MINVYTICLLVCTICEGGAGNTDLVLHMFRRIVYSKHTHTHVYTSIHTGIHIISSCEIDDLHKNAKFSFRTMINVIIYVYNYIIYVKNDTF